MLGLFVFTFILSLVMIIIGVLLIKCPPKKINSLVGYRTKKSSKNQEMWDFAQQFSGKAFIFIGLISIVVFFLIILLFVNKENLEDVFLILSYCQIAEFFVVILITEIALKRKIDNAKE